MNCLKNPLRAVPILVLATLFTPSCRLGKENVVFATATVIGIDVDSVPPRLSLGYDRFEGSIGPTTEDGQILPLLAGIAVTSNVLLSTFGFGVSTTFATGPAAVLAAKYLGVQGDFAPVSAAEELREDLLALSLATIQGSTSDVQREGNKSAPADPHLDDVQGQAGIAPDRAVRLASLQGGVQLRAGDELRRYYFATDTSLGLNVSFAAGSPGAPESISLGWKRKELAIVPVTVLAGAGGSKAVYLPSLVATSSTDVELNESRGAATSQFYATGMAANYLMGHGKLRRNIIERTGAPLLAIDEDRMSLNDVERRGKKAKEQALSAIDEMDAARLSDALQAAFNNGFATVGAFPPTVAPDKQREYIKEGIKIGNDEKEVGRLEDLVVELKALVKE